MVFRNLPFRTSPIFVWYQRKIYFLTLLFALPLLVSHTAQGQKLSEVRSSVSGGRGSGSSHPDSNTGTNHTHHYVGQHSGYGYHSGYYFHPFSAARWIYECDEQMVSPACWQSVHAQGSYPRYLLISSENGHFVEYPYVDDNLGSMVVDRKTDILYQESPTANGQWIVKNSYTQPENTSTVAFQLAPEYGYDLDGVHRPGLFFHLDSTTYRLGLEGGVTTYLEPLSNDKLDALTIGDLNLTFRVVQYDRIQFYLGLGARYMLDPTFYGGVNVAGILAVYPVRPLAVTFTGDIGTLGRTFMAQGRGSIGAVLKGWQPYLGIDAAQIDSVRFFGPTIGLRKWL